MAQYTEEQLNEFADIAEQAKAEGDTETLNRIRQLMAAEQQTPGPQQQAMKSPEPAQTGTVPVPVEQMPDARQVQSMGAGISEGVQRIGAMVSQFGAEAKDFWNTFVHGRGGSYDPRLGNENQTAGYAQRSKEELRRVMAEGEDAQRGLDIGVRNLTAGIVSNAAVMLGPEFATRAALGRTVTVAGNLFRQSTLGMVQEGLLSNGDQHGWNYLIAGGAPMLFGSVPAIYKNARNIIAQKVAEEATDSGALEGAQALRRLGGKPTGAMTTGSPFAVSLEAQARNMQMQKVYRDNQKVIVASVQRLLDTTPATTRDLDQAFVETQRLANSTLKSMQASASAKYGSDLAEVMRNGNDLVAAPTLAQAFNQVAKKSTNTLANAGQQILPTKFLVALKKATAGKQIKVGDLANAMEGLTSLAMDKDAPAVQRKLAGSLLEAVHKDLDVLQQQTQPGGQVAQGVQKLLAARAGYKQAQQNISMMQELAAYKLLGVPDDMEKVTADVLNTNFNKFKHEKQIAVRKWMEENSPDLLATMRQDEVRQIMQKANVNQATALGDKDITRMLERMTDPENTHRMRSSGLWDAKSLAQAEDIRKAARAFFNAPVGSKGAGTVIAPADVAPNVVSRSAIFIARQMARAGTGFLSSRFWTDPNLYQKLTKIQNTDGAVQMAARTELIKYMNKNYPVNDLGQDGEDQ